MVVHKLKLANVACKGGKADLQVGKVPPNKRQGILQPGRLQQLVCCPSAQPEHNRGVPLTVLHHERQELNDHLAGRAQQHLLLAALLGIVHGLLHSAKWERAGQARDFNNSEALSTNLPQAPLLPSRRQDPTAC